ncbi:UvrB/UvrC motif-containing protein, partial [Blautia hominis]|nr:UvrB/UvrC motif-containing protein [Blautia hominis]
GRARHTDGSGDRDRGAPCQGYISKEEYRKKVDKLLDFLNGNHREILIELEEKMLAASQEMNFEDAAQYRDLIQSVMRIGERQMITDQHGEDKDVVAVAQDG